MGPLGKSAAGVVYCLWPVGCVVGGGPGPRQARAPGSLAPCPELPMTATASTKINLRRTPLPASLSPHPQSELSDASALGFWGIVVDKTKSTGLQ